MDAIFVLWMVIKQIMEQSWFIETYKIIVCVITDDQNVCHVIADRFSIVRRNVVSMIKRMEENAPKEFNLPLNGIL